MKILKFYESTGIDLKYETYDWDDNICHMETKIHMQKDINGEWVNEDVSTAKFAQVRSDKGWRILNGDPNEAFSEFRDFGPRGKDAFLIDTKDAIDKESYGPSWYAFLECLKNAHIFAIITARGHSPNSIRKSVEYIIDTILDDDDKFNLYSNCLKFSYLFDKDYDKYDRIHKEKNISETRLIQDYLNQCDFFGVSSPEFAEKFGTGNASNPEKSKEEALKYFTHKCHEFGEKLGSSNVSVSFSDDDLKNIDHVEKVFTGELSLKYIYSEINMKYNLYDSSKRGQTPTRKKIRRGIIEENKINEGQGSSSVIGFTKWSNMTQNLYPGKSPADSYLNRFQNELGEINDLQRNGEKKKRKRTVKRIKK